MLRKSEVPIESARIIVVGRFIRYRPEKKIVEYLPEEAKNEKMAEKARKANLRKRAKKEELMSKNIREAVLRAGRAEEEAAQISNDSAVINEALENYSRLGPKVGESPESRRRTAAELAVAKEIGEGIVSTTAKPTSEPKTEAEAEIKDIITELPPPNAGTVASINSIRIRDLWNRSKPAYVLVNQGGNLMGVYETRAQALQAQAQAASSSS